MTMEKLNKNETLLDTVKNVGNFVVERALGGGWADLPASLDMEVQPLAEVIPLPPRPGHRPRAA